MPVLTSDFKNYIKLIERNVWGCWPFSFLSEFFKSEVLSKFLKYQSLLMNSSIKVPTKLCNQTDNTLY